LTGYRPQGGGRVTALCRQRMPKDGRGLTENELEGTTK
jgi:RNA 3'-terminal phosphate cyclase